MTLRAEASQQTFQNHVSVALGPARTKQVHLPSESAPVVMGLHGDVAAHYRVDHGSYVEHATTLDYLVGAAVACLTGTLGGMLSPLGQRLDRGQLRADGKGMIIKERGVLRIRSVEVTYHLRATEGVDLQKIRRAHDRHTDYCPVARSIGASIDITTHLILEQRGPRA
jgi:uncharacterized OsmC-like protein